MVDWPVHYSRAIENQLDVAHLPFVHRTTIGAGGRSRVEGPYVEADATHIRVWVTNSVDDGLAPRDQAQLAAAAAGHEPGLDFRFPGVWLLNISATFKNFIAFVPLNERCTRYYLRSYFRFGPAWLARPFGWLISLSNRYILGQDHRVVVTQTPAASPDATQDRLVGADRAIARQPRKQPDQRRKRSTNQLLGAEQRFNVRVLRLDCRPDSGQRTAPTEGS